jgi:hypothetical protein
MSDAAIAPAPTTQPDTDRADTDRAGAGAPSRIGRLLGLVRRLIDYGKDLADTLRQQPADPRAILRRRSFGTFDLGFVLASITRGLLRAAALETRLNQRAARGRDLGSAPGRPSAPRKPRAAQPATARTKAAQDPRLARLPTPEEIAAEVRRRPIGAVIADICRDLGIAPGHVDRTLWRDLNDAIMAYGGSGGGFIKGMLRRCFAAPDAWPSAIAPPASPVASPVSACARPP